MELRSDTAIVFALSSLVNPAGHTKAVPSGLRRFVTGLTFVSRTESTGPMEEI